MQLPVELSELPSLTGALKERELPKVEKSRIELKLATQQALFALSELPSLTPDLTDNELPNET
jgi:hypothetical protein